MNELETSSAPDPSEWGLTYEKTRRLLSSDQRIAANSTMPGLLSQRGYENTVWASTITEIIDQGHVARRPLVKDTQVNPPYVGRFPIYETELPELMQASGETVSSTAGELSKKVRVNPGLERKLWTTKVQRDIDDCQKKYPSSCAMQLGFLADKWDVDARHLKTNYRVFGGLMT